MRSSQVWSASGTNNSRFRHQNAWAEYTLYEMKSRLRAGRFTPTSNGFGIGRIFGVQITPESALYKKTGVAVVTGVADTTSVIEIHQSGILLLSTTVPPGPFTLTDFSLQNTHTELKITQTGSDSSIRQYTIPSGSYLRGGSTIAPGIAWGAWAMGSRRLQRTPTCGNVISWLASTSPFRGPD